MRRRHYYQNCASARASPIHESTLTICRLVLILPDSRRICVSMFACFSASCLIRESWRSRTQPSRSQHLLNGCTRLSVIAVGVLLSRTHADVSEVLACTLYAYCIDYNCAERVLQAMRMA